MMVITEPSVIPHGGAWRVSHPVTGETFSAQNILMTVYLFRQYCMANQLPVLDQEQIFSLMCEQHPEWCTEKPMRAPPVITQVVSAVREVGKWLFKGAPMTQAEALQKRREQCQGSADRSIPKCDYWSGNRCLKCGCSQAKLYMETTQCPIGRW